MPNIEVFFREKFPRTAAAFAVRMGYGVRVDGREIEGGVVVNFVDSFLGQYYARPTSTEGEAKLSDANQALVSEIGRLIIALRLRDMTIEQITKLCAEGGKAPIENLTNEAATDESLDAMVQRLRKELDTKPPMGFRP